MIEVLIATVLFAIAAGIVTSIVMHAVSGAGTARTGALSDAAIERTSAALRDDIARAVTADRASYRLRDPGEFEDAVRLNDVAYSTDPTSVGPLDIDDVVTATPKLLQVRADVDPASAGYECITWEAKLVGKIFTIERRVGAGAGCGSGNLGTRTLMRADTAVPGINQSPFSYDMICAGCPGAPGASSNCAPWRVTSVPQQQRRWVVAVHADLMSAAVRGSSAAVAEGSITAEVRSRDTQTYRGALGC